MQRGAKGLHAADPQLPLLRDQPPVITSEPVSFDRIYITHTPHDALLYACELARVNGKAIQPKHISGLMGKDVTRWSRICSGEHDLPSGDILKLCKTLRNDAYALWLNHELGYDLPSMRKAQDEKDRVIQRQAARIAELEREREIVVRFVQETRK